MVYIYTTLHIARQHITINLNCIIWLRSPATCGGVPFDGGSKVTLKWPGPSKHAYLPLRPMPPTPGSSPLSLHLLFSGFRSFVCCSLELFVYGQLLLLCATLPCHPATYLHTHLFPHAARHCLSICLSLDFGHYMFFFSLSLTASLPLPHCLSDVFQTLWHSILLPCLSSSGLLLPDYTFQHYTTLLHMLHTSTQHIMAHYIETQLKLRSRLYAIVSSCAHFHPFCLFYFFGPSSLGSLLPVYILVPFSSLYIDSISSCGIQYNTLNYPL